MSSTAQCCRICGATSYRRVIARDGAGALRPSGLYQCSGCSVVFADPKAWREGGPDLPPADAPTLRLTPLRPDYLPSPPSGAAPSFQTYMQMPVRAPEPGGGLPPAPGSGPDGGRTDR